MGLAFSAVGLLALPYAAAGLAKQERDALFKTVKEATHWPDAKVNAYVIGYYQRNDSSLSVEQRRLAGEAVAALWDEQGHLFRSPSGLPVAGAASPIDARVTAALDGKWQPAAEMPVSDLAGTKATAAGEPAFHYPSIPFLPELPPGVYVAPEPGTGVLGKQARYRLDDIFNALEEWKARQGLTAPDSGGTTQRRNPDLFRRFEGGGTITVSLQRRPESENERRRMEEMINAASKIAQRYDVEVTDEGVFLADTSRRVQLELPLDLTDLASLRIDPGQDGVRVRELQEYNTRDVLMAGLRVEPGHLTVTHANKLFEAGLLHAGSHGIPVHAVHTDVTDDMKALGERIGADRLILTRREGAGSDDPPSLWVNRGDQPSGDGSSVVTVSRQSGGTWRVEWAPEWVENPPTAVLEDTYLAWRNGLPDDPDRLAALPHIPPDQAPRLAPIPRGYLPDEVLSSMGTDTPPGVSPKVAALLRGADPGPDGVTLTLDDARLVAANILRRAKMLGAELILTQEGENEFVLRSGLAAGSSDPEPMPLPPGVLARAWKQLGRGEGVWVAARRPGW
jgi:hypothetical protein